MKKIAFFLCMLSVLLCGGMAYASLIGDDVVLAHEFPNLGDIYDGPYHVTVVSGDSDRILFDPFSREEKGYGVNVEASSILIDFFQRVDFSLYPFHGLVASDLYTGSYITGVAVNTNIGFFDPSRVAFGAHKVSINWAGSEVWPGNTFNIDLETEVIPEPATMLLLPLGLAGFRFFRRKNKFPPNFMI